jgi:hypothetical protein
MPVQFKRRDIWQPGGYRAARRPAANRILLVLPFWNGDKAQHIALARFIADLEPAHSEQVDILFLARFDAAPDDETIKYVSRKFNVHVYKCNRREVGWPHGCNGLFSGAIEFFHRMTRGGKIPAYKAMLIVEADCVPLSRTWLSQLMAEWDRVSREKYVCIAGAYIPNPNPADPRSRDHINGGCCFLSGDSDFMSWLFTRMGRVNAGWDWILAPQFKTRGWADIPAIWSHWRTDDKNEAQTRELMKHGVLLFHGVKGPNLLENARKILL